MSAHGRKAITNGGRVDGRSFKRRVGRSRFAARGVYGGAMGKKTLVRSVASLTTDDMGVRAAMFSAQPGIV